MKYPYERFLRFLVSRKLDVNQTLARYGLPRVGDLWVASCRGELRRSAPHALIQYISTPGGELVLRDGVLEWAREQQILPLWEMQPEFGGDGKGSSELDTAFRLFVNPFSRAVLGMLLLSRANEAETIGIVLEQFELAVTPAALGLYRQLFWDTSLVERATWQPFVQSLVSEEEKNYVAYGLQSPTVNEVRDLLGMDCTQVDHKAILNQIIGKAYNRFREAMDQPQPEQADAMKWADLALRAISTAKNAGGLTVDDGAPKTSAERFKKLFSVVPTKAKHPTLADLAGEVGKKEEKKEEKASGS